MGLLRVFDDKQHFLQVFDLKEADILSVFAFETYNGNLKFNHAAKVVFEIKAIKNRTITIEEFIREDINSGWLISDIKQL